MNEDLKIKIKKYKQINWDNLLRTDFHEKHDLKELKVPLSAIKNFIDPIVQYSNKLTTSHQNTANEILETFFQSIIEVINNYTDTAQRINTINSIIQAQQDIIFNYANFYTIINCYQQSDPSLSLEEPKKEKQKYQTAREEMEKELKKIRPLQSQYKELLARKEIDRYGDFFKKEARINFLFSYAFGALFYSSSIAICVLAYCYLKFDHTIEADSFIELLIKGDVINKIVIFSVILLVLSVIKQEYLALRHQFTLNRHRQNAISSHKEILSSIEKTANESEKEISNALLLEMAKAIFRPQDTGFIKQPKTTGGENQIVEISKSLFKPSK